MSECVSYCTSEYTSIYIRNVCNIGMAYYTIIIAAEQWSNKFKKNLSVPIHSNNVLKYGIVDSMYLYIIFNHGWDLNDVTKSNKINIENMVLSNILCTS